MVSKFSEKLENDHFKKYGLFGVFHCGFKPFPRVDLLIVVTDRIAGATRDGALDISKAFDSV